jgi:hypothetical protein
MRFLIMFNTLCSIGAMILYVFYLRNHSKQKEKIQGKTEPTAKKITKTYYLPTLRSIEL